MIHYPEIQRHDGALFFTVGETDRAAIATSIERLIDLLDQMEGDPDLEPYLAGFDRATDDREGDLDAFNCPGLSEGDENSDDEPLLAAPERHDTQTSWAQGSPDDREEENEHAGDILDEPHDSVDEGNDEPSLGWGNPQQHPLDVARGWTASDNDADTGGGLYFNGDGHHQARQLLRERVKDRRAPAIALDRTRVSVGYGRAL